MKDYARYDHLERVKGIKTPVVIFVADNTFEQVKKTAMALKLAMDNVQIIKVPAKHHFVFEE
jgi:hypothetical protein